MAWVANETEHRIYDPEAGYELFVDGGGSDMSMHFRLENAEGHSLFSAFKVFPKMTDKERENIGVDHGLEIVVWQVFSWVDQFRKEIKDSLLTFKATWGFHYPNTTYFVQFGRNGTLEK